MAIIIKKKALKPVNPFPDIPDPFGYGQRAVDYLRSLKHPKSRLPNKAFSLDPWQEEIVRKIYGPCDEYGNRIVRHAIILVPRGNRKTSLGAGLAMLHADGPEALPGSEILFAAAAQTQAKIAYREVQNIVSVSGRLWTRGYQNGKYSEHEHIRSQDHLNRLLFPDQIFLEAISQDSNVHHGRTPVFCLCDEIHAWPKRDLWDVIRTGLMKTSNTLQVTITTAGRGQTNLAYEVIEYGRKVLRGEIDDPSTLPIYFEAPRDADWKDENVWRLANPGLKYGYPDLGGLRQLAKEAESKPAEREAFKQLHLNIWGDRNAIRGNGYI